jgi:CHASE2 domain-containing sensor protein
MRKKSLADQFAILQAERDGIETAYQKLKSEYFAIAASGQSVASRSRNSWSPTAPSGRRS